jgi:hypothetical protein
MTQVTPSQTKNPYAPKPATPKPQAPLWAEKFGEQYDEKEKPEDGQAVTTQQAQMDNHEAWNQWLSAKPQIEYAQQQPLQNYDVVNEAEKIAASHEEKNNEAERIAEIKKQLHQAEIETVLLAADVLDTSAKLNGVNEHGFSSRGKMEFTSDALNTQKEFENEITEPAPRDPVANYIRETENAPREFKDSIDVKPPDKLVDFGLFFTFVGGSVREGTTGIRGFFKKMFRSSGLAMNNLLRKEIFFKSKKQQTPEQAAKEAKQNQNKQSFYSEMKYGIMRVLGLDKKRAMKQQIENTNLQAGMTNTSYEGISEPGGQIRENVLNDAEKNNSQRNNDREKQEKQRRLAMMSRGKGKSGPGISFSADKAHNMNNAAKLAG